MARRAKHTPLRVKLNNRLVGYLEKAASGAIAFQYAEEWLKLPNAIPVSQSMPLREDRYSGETVSAVFENLLPDSDELRRRVAEKVGAKGVDAYSMLAKIGRDCVGALQFVTDDDETAARDIKGESVSEEEIENILNNLVQTPLGLKRDDDFRISVAGAQEKTALLRHNGQWLKPHGTTPTTHILKTQIGELPNGIDLSNSVENEFYCLKLAHAFGLPVNRAEIEQFGKTKALVIERFDRRWTDEGHLLRLPQEDCCQALSVPPTLKYQSDGGPGTRQILELLKASATPIDDQVTFLAAQLFFWVIGATDGHAKNFSIALLPRNNFKMTPLYDILSAQPSLANYQIKRNQMKLAMSVGDNNHYRIYQIHPRHFEQTIKAAGIAKQTFRKALELIAKNGVNAFEAIEKELPNDFPMDIHTSIQEAALPRIKSIADFLNG